MSHFKPPNVLLIRCQLLWHLCLCLALLTSTAYGFAAPKRIAVVIPTTTSKVQAVYDEITLGLQQSSEEIDLLHFSLSITTVEGELNDWLEKNKPEIIITIGKNAHKITNEINYGAPIVAGGLSVHPKGASGVSLMGDPREFLNSVKEITPNVKRVYLIYKEDINGWWVNDARQCAVELGIKLVTLEAESLKKGAKLYKKLLKSARQETDAVWIPLVSVVPSKTVLPMVLRKAWERHLIVFTNSPTHTRQGALFSLYPDNTALGKQLLELALEQTLTKNTTPKVVLLKNMKRAFNWRTASHLGLEYTLDEEAGFDRIYPLQ